jgi:hypothetical protein
MGAERTLLLLMIRSREYVERVGEQVGPEDFADPAFRAIFEALLADPELRAAPTSMDPVAAKRLEELLAGSEELAHPARVLEESLARLRVEAITRQSRELEGQIAGATDPAEREMLMRRKNQLAEERRDIGLDHSHWARKVRALGTDERHR